MAGQSGTAVRVPINTHASHVPMCSQVLKWNFMTPREEFVDQLKTQMAACVAKWLMEDLFHTDFQKHIRAISTLMEVSLSLAFSLYLYLRWWSLQ